MRFILTTEYYSAMKRNGALTRATAWVNFKIVTLSGGSHKIPHIVGVHLYKLCRLGKPTEIESRRWWTEAGRRAEWE